MAPCTDLGQFAAAIRAHGESERASGALAAAALANITLLARFYDAIHSRDAGALGACFHRDMEVEIFTFPRLPHGAAHGRDAVVAMTLANFGALAIDRVTLESLVAGADTTLMVGQDRGRVRATGEPYAWSVIQEAKYVDGLMHRARLWLLDSTPLDAPAQPGGRPAAR